MKGAALITLLAAAPADVLERHQCFRCHDYPSAVQHAPELGCASCHTKLSSGAMNDQAQRWDPKVWQRFVKRTSEHFTHVPPLAGLSRLRTSWLKSFLRAPYDLRPHVSESMIRNALTDADLTELAALWKTQPDETPPPKPAQLEQAKAAFTAQGCASCHAAAKAEAPAQFLAPDLRHTRDRMNFSAVVDYLSNPKRVNPATLMLPAADARLLAEWVYFGDLGPAPVRSETKALPYDAKAKVPRYEEVEARVFKAVCWHCHSNPDYANGNGGPGMSGGMGFKARGLSFASFEEVMNGSRDDAGKPQSIFRKGPSGEPVLLEVLRARWHEEAGRAGPEGPIGMPLGLPGLSAEDYALVERWVKGGRPPPRGLAAEEADPSQVTAPRRER